MRKTPGIVSSGSDSDVEEPQPTGTLPPKKVKTGSPNESLSVSDFVLVKVPTKKGGYRNYLAQILLVPDCENSETSCDIPVMYEVMYYKAVAGSKNTKFIPNADDTDHVERSAIFMKVEQPICNNRGQFVFSRTLNVYQ